ncbi:MAG: ATP-binding cassette domain-containing protein, partial [Rikenellaceae bacterium]
LRILTGDLMPDSGEVDLGSSVKFGYYRQEGMQFDDNAKVIDVARSIAEVVTLGDGSTIGVSQFLNQFLFEPSVQHSFVAKLSGGERRRLYLLTVLMQSPNFLILDEPTNDLDIATLNVLEAYLENFGGCVIVVSHDRYFMDKVTDHLLVFEGEGKTKIFEGNYTQYRNSCQEKAEMQSQSQQSTKPSQNSQRNANKAKKISYKEQIELSAIETEISQLEAEKASLEQSMSSGEVSTDDIVRISIRHGEVNNLIDEKTMRWLELEELKS